MQPATPAAYGLLHDGALILSRLESNGLPIDERALDSALESVRDQISDAESSLRDMDVYYEQRKRYGKKSNVNSRDQLATILYEVLGIPGGQKSDAGNYILDDKVLENIDLDYCHHFQHLQKLQKLYGTYLKSFKENLCKGKIHGFFNLHTVSSYRSSADSPNLTNIPIRDDVIGGIIRSVVRPHDPDYCLLEVDYSSLEVRTAAFYHKDPTMMEYLETGHDMHTDAARKCFLLENVEKPIRAAVKGGCVFAFQYGSYYALVAEQLWQFACRHRMRSGELLVEHLKNKGVSGLGSERDPRPGSFMGLIKKVEEWFWQEQFPVYGQWRKDWFSAYQRNGCFYTLTGFRLHGVYKRNFVLNAAVQGTGFHILLLSIIEMAKRLGRSSIRAKIINEIHDSVLFEVHREDVADLSSLAKEVMCHYVRSKWPWIILPLEVEMELGDTWGSKKPYAF